MLYLIRQLLDHVAPQLHLHSTILNSHCKIKHRDYHWQDSYPPDITLHLAQCSVSDVLQPIYSQNRADRRASMPIAGSDEPWVDQLCDQLSHRHSIFPPVPRIPSMYSSQNLARPRPVGRPPAAVEPRPDYRRPHTPTSRHNPHFPDFDGYYAQAVQDINRRAANINDEEDLYGASPPRNRPDVPSSNVLSSSRRPTTPTRIPTPPNDPMRTPRMYSPTPRPRSSTVPSIARASDESDESEATVVSSFDKSSATTDNPENDTTSLSDTRVEDDESEKIDVSSLERPGDPVGRSKFDRANVKKSVKKPLFFGKVAASSPSITTPKEPLQKSLRHQNSFSNLKKSSVKNNSVESLDNVSTTSDLPTNIDHKVEENKAAPAIGGKIKGNGSHDRPPTRLGGPRPSRSMFNLRQKAQTPTPRTFVISGPMNMQHVSGNGTALEGVLTRQVKEQASISNLKKSVTSAQGNGNEKPLMVKSKTTVRFTEQTSPRPAKATTFVHNSGRGIVPSTDKSSLTIVEVEGTKFVMLNPSSPAKTTSGPTSGMKKSSSTSAKIGGRAATPNLIKSSTSAQITERAPAPNLTKSSTSAQLNGRISALGRWAQRANPVTTRPNSKLKGDKLRASIGQTYKPVHVSGEGTAFHNVQDEIHAPSQPSLPAQAPKPVVTQDSVISTPFNVVHISGEAALRKLLDDGRAPAPAPYAQPPRSATPAFGVRMPRPNSKAKNHFKRSGSSAVVISSPLNPIHVSGDGTAFDEVMGKSNSSNNDMEDSTKKISPRRYQSMQDFRVRDAASPTRIHHQFLKISRVATLLLQSLQ